MRARWHEVRSHGEVARRARVVEQGGWLIRRAAAASGARRAAGAPNRRPQETREWIPIDHPWSRTRRIKPSNYPEPFASRMAGRIKRPLGDAFGLASFALNHVTLPRRVVGATTALGAGRVRARAVGRAGAGARRRRARLAAGMCAGFPRGGTAHHLVTSAADATYLGWATGERATRSITRTTICRRSGPKTLPLWRFARKDGTRIDLRARRRRHRARAADAHAVPERAPARLGRGGCRHRR
jgi:uncharacterized cupin superfamily protein